MSIKTIILAFSLLFLSLVVSRLHLVGIFRTDIPEPGNTFVLSGYGPCEAKPGPIGGEDIAYWESQSLIFISSADRRTMVHNQGFDVKGNIFTYSLSSKTFTKIPLEGYSGDFHPHGVSLYEEEGETLLFVVNHHATLTDSVEIFQVQTATNGQISLKHVETVRDQDHLISLNDVAAVGRRSFYVTNDFGLDRHHFVRRNLEFLLPWTSTSSVVYYDGRSARFVLGRSIVADPSITNGRAQRRTVEMANGIARSLDKKRLYVAETLRSTISVWSLADPLALTLVEEIHLETGVDNIEVRPIFNKEHRTSTSEHQESLYVGSHPNLIKFPAHAFSPAKTSPSEVVRVDIDGYTSPIMLGKSTVFLDSGSLISASSVGGIFADQLIVAPVFDSRIVVCPKKQ